MIKEKVEEDISLKQHVKSTKENGWMMWQSAE